MTVEDAIRQRKSIKVFHTEPVPSEIINKCLEGAVWAPNHKMTEPWRFRVVTGEGRDGLAHKIGEEIVSDTGSDGEAKAEKERQKLLSAPALIIVYSEPGTNPTMRRENSLATAAAVQNLLLLAEFQGLGAIWRTSAYYERENVRKYLQAHESWDFVASVFLGYPNQRDVKRSRDTADYKTVWIGSDNSQ